MKLYQIDSFTDQLFKGNPAAVCILDKNLSDEQMQDIAVEMNLSETAFVKVGDESCDLRWFTPAKEVPLCGHATLASAFVLFNEGYWTEDTPIVFNTLSGKLIVEKQADGSLMMDFPGTIPSPVNRTDRETIESAFGGKLREVLTVPGELILIFEDLETLLSTQPAPDYVSGLAENGVITSAWAGNDNYDFASRYFAPNLGINEDPVTGFMHTILTPYWSRVQGQPTFEAFQASKRTGRMKTRLKGDRVILEGQAVKVFESVLDI